MPRIILGILIADAILAKINENNAGIIHEIIHTII